MTDLNEYPFVTSIIVCRNEEDYIQLSIESLINQNYPKERYEILVVDGLSTDRTIDIVNNLKRIHGNIHLLENSKKILASGWNIGLKNSKGDYVFRIDAHSTVGIDYIESCVKLLEKDKDIVCCGGLVTFKTKDSKAELISMVMSSPFGIGNSKYRYSTKKGYVDTVAYGMYRKEIFEKIGYFDERLVRNQDIDLHNRIHKIGGKFYLDPDIKVTYFTRTSITKIMKQAYGNGKWNLILAKKNPKAISLRHIVPLCFVLSLIIIPILSILIAPFIYVLFIELAFYAFFAFVFSLKKTKKVNQVLRMPFMFIALHLSYGIGSLTGIFKTI